MLEKDFCNSCYNICESFTYDINGIEIYYRCGLNNERLKEEKKSCLCCESCLINNNKIIKKNT